MPVDRPSWPPVAAPRPTPPTPAPATTPCLFPPPPPAAGARRGRAQHPGQAHRRVQRPLARPPRAHPREPRAAARGGCGRRRRGRRDGARHARRARQAAAAGEALGREHAPLFFVLHASPVRHIASLTLASPAPRCAQANGAGAAGGPGASLAVVSRGPILASHNTRARRILLQARRTSHAPPPPLPTAPRVQPTPLEPTASLPSNPAAARPGNEGPWDRGD